MMKAIIEIELEIDGEWRPSDKELLIEQIIQYPYNGVWGIDEDRLAVLANSMTVEIREE